ncbi:ATP-dependent protease ATP-binding subunit ClpX [Halorhodospira abdelmalekii]|uniref:ATP-dependent Clp protease ATP-binding subunit ClpX n=1 Tax=Halorhodospira abdelmalekii TaxID=421629 RepID=UPI001905EF0E|nr:ATP-dependent Clp protease ATP-binding subunit ClpX [Halorhodospira abdelmalekii]MBK1734038.1 ATP-dependent protease ATP-binding subunit ClpX [Halorhodospira abdelmalekii]
MRGPTYGEAWRNGLPALDEPELRPEIERERRCSFCAREESVAGALIGGEQAYICEACLEACNEVLEVDRRRRQERILATLPAPRALRRHLDHYVIGQERAKMVLAVAIYNHYKRLVWAARGSDVELGKSNILLVGPSGSGKSYLAECLARAVEVPFAAVDATRLTASGYAGEDADSVIARLLAVCDYDPERASRGIIYIDEIDKLAVRAESATVRDVAGEGTQQALLKLLEGRTVSLAVPGRKGREVRVDTRDVLFICGGAFEALRQQRANRAAGRGVGFAAHLDGGVGPLRPGSVELQEYGLLPELVGRLPIVEELAELGEDELVRVLTEPRNAPVRQYQALLARDGCELQFTPGALRAIARRAYARGTGARGLRAILEGILLEPMFAVPAANGGVERLIVDEETVAGDSPIYELIGERRHAG